MTRIAITLTLVILCLPAYALASGGVLEINQTCAVETGCFPSDAPGFPVSITSSAGARSFRLTSDLTTTDAFTDVIQIQAEDVTLDLGGFLIEGPGTCSGNPAVCTLTSGTGIGVEATAFGATVLNGTVAGMGSSGISLRDRGRVVDVSVRENRLAGVFADDGSVFTRVTSYRNGQNGIQGDFAAVVENSASYRNGGYGILVSVGAIVRGNAVYSNGLDGIRVNAGCVVEGNAVRGNLGYGLFLSSGSVFRGNAVTTLTGSTGTTQGGVDGGGNVCGLSLGCP